MQGIVGGRDVRAARPGLARRQPRDRARPRVCELLQNALEHGAGAMRIELTRRDGDVILAIADEGAGAHGAGGRGSRSSARSSPTSCRAASTSTARARGDVPGMSLCRRCSSSAPRRRVPRRPPLSRARRLLARDRGGVEPGEAFPVAALRGAGRGDRAGGGPAAAAWRESPTCASAWEEEPGLREHVETLFMNIKPIKSQKLNEEHVGYRWLRRRGGRRAPLLA